MQVANRGFSNSIEAYKRVERLADVLLCVRLRWAERGRHERLG